MTGINTHIYATMFNKNLIFFFTDDAAWASPLIWLSSFVIHLPPTSYIRLVAGLILLANALFNLLEDSASTNVFLAAEMAFEWSATTDCLWRFPGLEAVQLKRLVNWGSSQILTDLDCSQKHYSKNSLHWQPMQMLAPRNNFDHEEFYQPYFQLSHCVVQLYH